MNTLTLLWKLKKAPFDSNPTIHSLIMNGDLDIINMSHSVRRINYVALYEATFARLRRTMEPNRFFLLLELLIKDYSEEHSTKARNYLESKIRQYINEGHDGGYGQSVKTALAEQGAFDKIQIPFKLQSELYS